MLNMMRKNVLVDLGPVSNVLGAELIETPDFYKRINSRGKIASVGPKCLRFSGSDIGKECVIAVDHVAENRLSPETSKGMGLESHWHFIMHENKIQVLLEA